MRSPPTLYIRPAIDEDAAAISAIRVAAWQRAYQDFMPHDYLANLNLTANLAMLAAQLNKQSRDFNVSVAQYTKEVIGFLILGQPRFATSETTVELWALNIAPDYWRMGIASKLITHAINNAKTQFNCISLWCIKGNIPALACYQRQGFTASGQERSSTHLTGHNLVEIEFILPLGNL